MDNILAEKYGTNLATHSIEVNIDDLSGKYYLPDDSILRDKVVVGVAIMDNETDDAKSPLGRTLASNVANRSSYLTLVDVNNHLIDQHPIPDLMVSPTDKGWMIITINRFHPSKSFIECSNTGALTAGESYVLQFAYINK